MAEEKDFGRKRERRRGVVRMEKEAEEQFGRKKRRKSSSHICHISLQSQSRRCSWVL